MIFHASYRFHISHCKIQSRTGRLPEAGHKFSLRSCIMSPDGAWIVIGDDSFGDRNFMKLPHGHQITAGCRAGCTRVMQPVLRQEDPHCIQGWHLQVVSCLDMCFFAWCLQSCLLKLPYIYMHTHTHTYIYNHIYILYIHDNQAFARCLTSVY